VILAAESNRNDQFYGYMAIGLVRPIDWKQKELGLHVMVSNTDPMETAYGFCRFKR
jgi:hypothetical protein